MERASRLESTRRNLRLARYGVVAVSAAAFAGIAVAARQAHAGSATSPPSATVSESAVSTGDDSQSESFGDFGSSSLGPSNGGAPSAQSGGS